MCSTDKLFADMAKGCLCALFASEAQHHQEKGRKEYRRTFLE